MKKLMILGATYTQVPLVQIAKQKGYYTIVAGTKGDYPANQYADELCHVDISNPEEVLKKAVELNIDGIAACCMDLPIRSLGYVCDKLRLTGISEKTAILSNNKYLMKEELVKHGVNTPKFMKIEDVCDLEDAILQIKSPWVIKALDLQASRGVFIANTKEELIENFYTIKTMSRENYCIVEEFIDGIDIGAQAFVYKGEVLFVLPHNDEVYRGDANKPIGHSVPLQAHNDVNNAVCDIVKKAINAIGADNCAVNVDMILKGGNVYLIELSGRAGATCLPEIVSNYYGINYYEMILEMAMGNNPKEIFANRCIMNSAVAAKCIISQTSGKITEWKEFVSDRLLVEKRFYGIGDLINKFEDGKDRIGEVVVSGQELDECFRTIECYENSIQIEALR